MSRPGPPRTPSDANASMAVSDLVSLTATEIAALLRSRRVSARQVMQAHLERIERVNPRLNAICTLAGEEALEQADAADDAMARGEATGPLHGLPIAIKDAVLTRGLRTTWGSPIYRDFVPDTDELLVERLKAAGAIVFGKTNVPEFTAGSQTYNEVFGDTLNPYDPTRTCGGSSGGTAVALATGMMPIGDGSDLGGSLRNPGSYCNVVGFRPSPGRVPTWPKALGWDTLVVQGPMARTVSDAALLMRVMAGPDERCPISLPEPGEAFATPLERDFRGVRLAWTPDLGRYPVHPTVTGVLEAQLAAFADLGAHVEPAHPNVSDADECFRVLRAWRYALAHEAHLRHHRDRLKDTVIWNTEEGLKLDGLAVARAEERRTALYQRVRAFLERYEFLLLPVSPVPPFPIEQRWVTEIAGHRLETYIDWMALCYVITLTGLPAVSVPAGFTRDGLPVGLQIVGRPRQDLAVLQLAHAFERATRAGERRPALAGAA